MVQIGNIHIGKTDTAKKTPIDIGEAFLLSQQLYYRYTCIEITHHYLRMAHDPDFRLLIKTGLKYLEKEVNLLRQQMELYNIPQPSRSPRTVLTDTKESETSLLTDQIIYEQIHNGCVNAIEKTSAMPYPS